jgi:hypothetical protein
MNKIAPAKSIAEILNICIPIDFVLEISKIEVILNADFLTEFFTKNLYYSTFPQTLYLYHSFSHTPACECALSAERSDIEKFLA